MTLGFVVPDPSNLERNFPTVPLSLLATKESWRKEIYRPATSTHKWWAKRLGTIFRGILVSASSSTDMDPMDNYSRAFDLQNAIVLDPFSGSGTTGVEVLKLGGKPICFDINPVATLVERQAMQPWDMERLNAAYLEVERKCKQSIDRLHQTQDGRTVLYYFWVATVDCPKCSSRVRLFDSPIFSKNAYPKRVPEAQLVCPICLEIKSSSYDFVTDVCPNGHEIVPEGAVHGAKAVCECGHAFKIIDALNGEPPRSEMFAKMVVDASGQKTYESITQWDRDLYRECESRLMHLPSDQVIPAGSLVPGYNTDQALRWNFRKWSDFFNARQLLSLSMIATAIRDLNGFSPEREALATLFSGTLEFNNVFASFKGEGTGAVRHMFSNHVLKPERTPLEAHPWGTPQSSGSFSTLFKSRLVRADAYKNLPFDLVFNGGEIERRTGVSAPLNPKIVGTWDRFVCETGSTAYIATKDSAHSDIPDESVDFVVTDPPYMDNVQYAELADFFHAWLSQMRPFQGYPVHDSTRAVGEVQNSDPSAFGEAITAVWRECARVLKPGGILAFTFHQARISGWVQVVQSLKDAGLCVTAIQPVKGEMSTSLVKAGSREPSNLDSILVCRKIDDLKMGDVPSKEMAIKTAVGRLRSLHDSGIAVGAGDVRSVLRGSLLTSVAMAGSDLDEVAVREIDDAVSHAVNEYLRGVR